MLNAALRRFAPDSKRDVSRDELLDEAALEAMQPHWHRREPAPDEVLAGLEITATILELLSPEERQIVCWHVLDRLSFVRIGAMLGHSPDAVRRTFNMALERLATSPLCQAVA